MKAIPTTYRGTLFRSRLEAIWAKHFTDRGLPWDYEPDGFKLDDGTMYLPDFWLPTARAWVEIKGDHLQRISKLEAFADQLWRESGAKNVNDKAAPMVLLLRTPRTDEWGQFIMSGSPIGVSGIDRRYSTGWAHCPECGASTVIALWQTYCRSCDHPVGGYEGWMNNDSNKALDWMYAQPFDLTVGRYTR